MGVPGYASSMILELFTNADLAGGYPGDSDLRIRFLFHNGTASNSSTPTAYPLFGESADTISWNEFSKGLGGFVVSSTEQWCTKCGNSTGSCAAYASGDDAKNGGAAANQDSGGHGMSAAIGGVIGAFVTLAVVLGSLLAVMLLGGFRIVRKAAVATSAAPGVDAKA